VALAAAVALAACSSTDDLSQEDEAQEQQEQELGLTVSDREGTKTRQGVEVSVLTTFAPDSSPVAVAATNMGDVVAVAGSKVVSIAPNGRQKLLTTISGGAFGSAIGIAYDKFHRLHAALPQSMAPPARGTILSVSANGRRLTPVPGSEGMVAPDGFGLDSATGDLYVTDIFGNGLWRVTPGPGGTAQLWTSHTTDPRLLLPDGVKIFKRAAYVSIQTGKILRIPINLDGSAGAAQVWAQIDEPGVFFDDMVLDDRTGNVYVTRPDRNHLLQITPAGVITPIASHADGLLGAANMALIHAGKSTIIYLANSNNDFLGTGATGGAGPAVLKVTIRARP
jgi:hypothetical protein